MPSSRRSIASKAFRPWTSSRPMSMTTTIRSGPMTRQRILVTIAAVASGVMSAAGQGGVRAAQFPGGGTQQPQALVARFDKDGDKRLNAAERQAAKAYV